MDQGQDEPIVNKGPQYYLGSITDPKLTPWVSYSPSLRASVHVNIAFLCSGLSFAQYLGVSFNCCR